jgi:hypothetical protein
LDHEKSIASEPELPGAGSPEKFMERLNRQLRRIGLVVEELPVKTRPSGGPPCFRAAGASYKDWLAQASVSYETVPYRLSMPAEPNYCHDCHRAFRDEMIADGTCLFPNTRFEVVKELGEPDTVGMCRSPDVAPDQYPLYDVILNRRRPT